MTITRSYPKKNTPLSSILPSVMVSPIYIYLLVGSNLYESPESPIHILSKVRPCDHLKRIVDAWNEPSKLTRVPPENVSTCFFHSLCYSHPEKNTAYGLWLVVSTPWKIWKSVGCTIPNWMGKSSSNVPFVNHQAAPAHPSLIGVFFLSSSVSSMTCRTATMPMVISILRSRWM